MDGGIHQCVSLPQSVCESLQVSWVCIQLEASKKKTTKNSEVSVGGIHSVKMSVFLLTSVGTPPPGHATSQVPGKSRLL